MSAHFDRWRGHFEEAFVPFIPRPGEKPEGGGCWSFLVLQDDKGDDDGRVGGGKEREVTTVAVLLTARQN